MLQQTIASNWRQVNVTSTTTATLVSTLVATALALKSGVAATLPTGTVIQIAVTPSADILVEDGWTADTVTLTAGTRRIFALKDAPNLIKFKNAATVTVELYFGR